MVTHPQIHCNNQHLKRNEEYKRTYLNKINISLFIKLMQMGNQGEKWSNGQSLWIGRLRHKYFMSSFKCHIGTLHCSRK